MSRLQKSSLYPPINSMPKPHTNLREIALTCLMSISQTRASVAAVVDNAFRKHALSGRERRFVNGLVYGVVRWQKHLDWVLNHYINPRFQLDTRHRNILRLGAFQLLHLDGIPAHAAIFETVQLAKGRSGQGGPAYKQRVSKTAGFINGVLRSVQRKAHTLTYPRLGDNPVEHISISQSYPTWMVKRWLEARGVSWTLEFCRASNQVAPLSLRVNSLVTQREELRQSLAANGIATRLSQIATDGLILDNLASSADEDALKALLNREDIYVQDESAMLVAPLLAPAEMQLIVEVCAAPGGKTTHLAHLMGNAGKIIAVDVSDKRLAMLKKNCTRVGALNVETLALDATQADLGFIANADAVLIDVPCSGFGTLRRHADIRWNRTAEHLRMLREVQLNLLRNAATHLKRGGVLVYSTCSIEPQENEDIIHRFLAEFPMYTVEHARTFLPHLPPNALTPEGFVQTFPHEHGVDGAFAARLRKND